MEQFPNFSAPALTPEGLYLQDQKRRKWDESERRVFHGVSSYNDRVGIPNDRLRLIDKKLQDLEWQRRQLYFERYYILNPQ